MVARLERGLEERLRRSADRPLHLIVGVRGGLDERAEELGRRGLAVHRRLPLVGALAVGATGAQALALREEPWVAWIEEDREVRATGAGEGGRG